MRASDHKLVRFSESVRSKVYLRREGGLEKGISFALSCDHFTRKGRAGCQGDCVNNNSIDHEESYSGW